MGYQSSPLAELDPNPRCGFCDLHVRKNRPNPRGRVTHPVLGSLSCVLADGAGADVPGWLEDGRQGTRALHVTHDRVVQLPKVSRLLTGVGGRGLDGTAGIRPRHGGVARRRLGRRPFRRIHPPTRPCLRRSNGHAGQTDMSHARERERESWPPWWEGRVRSRPIGT